jgi:1-acyl-sn-glycerol-3-phosphate acyltransferase
MVTLYLIVADILGMATFIYLLDYRVDGVINNPLVIIGSVVIGLITAILAAFLYLEITYCLFSKNKPETNDFKHYIGKGIVKVLLDLFRIKVIVKGLNQLPQVGNFIVYSNHTSELDIPIIMNSLKESPVAFLSKQAIRKYPSVGKWAESIGCVFLDREDNKKGLYAITDVIEKVKSGLVMTIFPEGTFKRGKTELLKFRNGAFKVALESGVSLVPITLVKEDNFHSKKWPLRKQYTVVIHEPLIYETIKDLKTNDLSSMVKDIINRGIII